MEIINGTSLSQMCDYSFGDHMGGANPQHLPGGFMKLANGSNVEFLFECKKYEGKVMTLFIDNIRLYNRPLWVNAGNDALWVEFLLKHNDLLDLCRKLPKNKFVIFTSHEDTPIDEHIVVPKNVLAIYATNAQYNNAIIHPFPYGLQRQIGNNDKRIEIMKEYVEKDERKEPTKLLYINCGIGRNEERKPLVDFEGLNWTTARFDKDSKFFPYERYRDFLEEIKDHKFMACPQGHGMDCHRNWESLYLRRVPVMLENPYFRRLMDGFPVLFVNSWKELNESMLKDNNHLYEQAQTMSLDKLDLNLIFKSIIKKHAERK